MCRSLREDSRSLAELKEKLFILWGDLEELKSAGTVLPAGSNAEKRASSNPFECCIQEYGVPIPAIDRSDSDRTDTKWQRMHRMFGTTVI